MVPARILNHQYTHVVIGFRRLPEILDPSIYAFHQFLYGFMLVFAQRGIRFRLQGYRRRRAKKDGGAPVFLLVYTVRLGPDDNRSELTTEIADASVVSVRWKTEKPKKV